MQALPDVLIVAMPKEAVALRLVRALEEAGRCVAHCDGISAARMFTIRVAGTSKSVEPTLPMFVGASAWWATAPLNTPEERFLHTEAYAAFWAAAALSSAPVINRPSPTGAVGRMTWGAIACLLNFDPGDARGEIYCSGPEVIGAAKDMWGEDSDFRVAPLAKLKLGAPLRGRTINPAAQYEIVTVVGCRGFLATKDTRSVDLDLVRRSISLVQRVGAHFATVTWAIDSGGAAPVRLNPAPSMQELGYSWNDVAAALCEDLTP